MKLYIEEVVRVTPVGDYYSITALRRAKKKPNGIRETTIVKINNGVQPALPPSYLNEETEE